MLLSKVATDKETIDEPLKMEVLIHHLWCQNMVMLQTPGLDCITKILMQLFLISSTATDNENSSFNLSMTLSGLESRGPADMTGGNSTSDCRALDSAKSSSQPQKQDFTPKVH